MLKLKKYVSHKTVGALKIMEIFHGDPYAKVHAAAAQLVFEDGQTLDVPSDYIKRHQPEAGGYFVEYEDEYVSYSPAKPFEQGYTEIEDGRPSTEGTTTRNTEIQGE